MSNFTIWYYLRVFLLLIKSGRYNIKENYIYFNLFLYTKLMLSLKLMLACWVCWFIYFVVCFLPFCCCLFYVVVEYFIVYFIFIYLYVSERRNRIDSNKFRLNYVSHYFQYELVYQTFGRHRFNHIIANLDVFIRRFNEIQYWVVTELCLTQSLSKRVQILRKMIKLAS